MRYKVELEQEIDGWMLLLDCLQPILVFKVRRIGIYVAVDKWIGQNGPCMEGRKEGRWGDDPPTARPFFSRLAHFRPKIQQAEKRIFYMPNWSKSGWQKKWQLANNYVYILECLQFTYLQQFKQMKESRNKNRNWANVWGLREGTSGLG